LRFWASLTGCGQHLYRHDGAPSSSIQIARQDRCVLRRSECALPVQNGHGAGLLLSNQLDKERTAAYRDSSGPNSRSDAHYATIVGNWEEPSGESRLVCWAGRR
jgi:hypothetical protein